MSIAVARWIRRLRSQRGAYVLGNYANSGFGLLLPFLLVRVTGRVAALDAFVILQSAAFVAATGMRTSIAAAVVPLSRQISASKGYRRTLFVAFGIVSLTALLIATLAIVFEQAITSDAVVSAIEAPHRVYRAFIGYFFMATISAFLGSYFVAVGKLVLSVMPQLFVNISLAAYYSLSLFGLVPFSFPSAAAVYFAGAAIPAAGMMVGFVLSLDRSTRRASADWEALFRFLRTFWAMLAAAIVTRAVSPIERRLAAGITTGGAFTVDLAHRIMVRVAGVLMNSVTLASFGDLSASVRDQDPDRRSAILKSDFRRLGTINFASAVVSQLIIVPIVAVLVSGNEAGALSQFSILVSAYAGGVFVLGLFDILRNLLFAENRGGIVSLITVSQTAVNLVVLFLLADRTGIFAIPIAYTLAVLSTVMILSLVALTPADRSTPSFRSFLIKTGTAVGISFALSLAWTAIR